jgi:hypothetical protein
MVKSTYNPNDNWIQEYHDKHGTFPTIKLPLNSLNPVGTREMIDNLASFPSLEGAMSRVIHGYGDEKWDDLKKSIKKIGLQRKICIYEDIKEGEVSYPIQDGHHRACILNELKGPNYIVEVEIVQRRTYTTENRVKLKSINPINVHKVSTSDVTKKVRDNLQKQIERKLADIKSKSVNGEKLYTFTKVNKTYKDYL